MGRETRVVLKGLPRRARALMKTTKLDLPMRILEGVLWREVGVGSGCQCSWSYEVVFEVAVMNRVAAAADKIGVVVFGFRRATAASSGSEEVVGG